MNFGPRRPLMDVMSGPPSLRLQRPGPQRSVLIVDDEPCMVQLYRRVLAGRFDCFAVSSAEAALAILGSGTFFDVIFCDLLLPHMSGRELFTRLRLAYPDQAARLVIVSGAAVPPRDDDFMMALEHRWLAKPMSAQDLRSIAATVACAQRAA